MTGQVGLGESLPFLAPYEEYKRVDYMIRMGEMTLLRVEKPFSQTDYAIPPYISKTRPTSLETCVISGATEKGLRYSNATLQECGSDSDALCLWLPQGSACQAHWGGLVVCLQNGYWQGVGAFRGCDAGQTVQPIWFFYDGLQSAMKTEVRGIASPECPTLRCIQGLCMREPYVCDGVPHCRDMADESEERCQAKTTVYCDAKNGCEGEARGERLVFFLF